MQRLQVNEISIVKGGNIQGDTINQMSETNITGELQVNNHRIHTKNNTRTFLILC